MPGVVVYTAYYWIPGIIPQQYHWHHHALRTGRRSSCIVVYTSLVAWVDDPTIISSPHGLLRVRPMPDAVIVAFFLLPSSSDNLVEKTSLLTRVGGRSSWVIHTITILLCWFSCCLEGFWFVKTLGVKPDFTLLTPPSENKNGAPKPSRWDNSIHFTLLRCNAGSRVDPLQVWTTNIAQKTYSQHPIHLGKESSLR